MPERIEVVRRAIEFAKPQYLPPEIVDVFPVFDINTTGLKSLREKLDGKMCVKASVGMRTTLAGGSPEDAAKEAAELIKTFHSAQGGSSRR